MSWSENQRAFALASMDIALEKGEIPLTIQALPHKEQ
jgi:hypothetical protein